MSFSRSSATPPTSSTPSSAPSPPSTPVASSSTWQPCLRSWLENFCFFGNKLHHIFSKKVLHFLYPEPLDQALLLFCYYKWMLSKYHNFVLLVVCNTYLLNVYQFIQNSWNFGSIWRGTLEEDHPPKNERCEHEKMLLYKVFIWLCVCSWNLGCCRSHKDCHSMDACMYDSDCGAKTKISDVEEQEESVGCLFFKYLKTKINDIDLYFYLVIDLCVTT